MLFYGFLRDFRNRIVLDAANHEYRSADHNDKHCNVIRFWRKARILVEIIKRDERNDKISGGRNGQTFEIVLIEPNELNVKASKSQCSANSRKCCKQQSHLILI